MANDELERRVEVLEEQVAALGRALRWTVEQKMPEVVHPRDVESTIPNAERIVLILNDAGF